MRYALLLAPLALAACDKPIAPVPAENTAAPELSNFQKQAVALTPGQRNGVFIRAIRDSGFDCQGVVESHRQADGMHGEPGYQAKCTDGTNYSILLDAGGTAHVAVRTGRLDRK